MNSSRFLLRGRNSLRSRNRVVRRKLGFQHELLEERVLLASDLASVTWSGGGDGRVADRTARATMTARG